MNTTVTSGQMSQFLTLLEQKAMTPERFQKLLSNGILADVCDVKANLDNRLAIQRGLKHVIDLNADPLVPDGWSVVRHQKGGMFEWNPNKVTLYLSEHQRSGNSICSNALCKELVGKSVFNANLLDFLLGHQGLIPEEWKGKDIYFWGTIYLLPYCSPCVRFLYWSGGKWSCSYSRPASIYADLGSNQPALVLAA